MMRNPKIVEQIAQKSVAQFLLNGTFLPSPRQLMAHASCCNMVLKKEMARFFDIKIKKTAEMEIDLWLLFFDFKH